jgi:hypothetical protein
MQVDRTVKTAHVPVEDGTWQLFDEDIAPVPK